MDGWMQRYTQASATVNPHGNVLVVQMIVHANAEVVLIDAFRVLPRAIAEDQVTIPHFGRLKDFLRYVPVEYELLRQPRDWIC